jgi:hypothetical protein
MMKLVEQVIQAFVIRFAAAQLAGSFEQVPLISTK